MMSEEEISLESLKRGVLWNKPKTPHMIQFEEEYGHRAIKANKITGWYELFCSGGKVRKLDGSNVKTETQVDWAIKQLYAYLKAKNKTQAVIRKIHYWITKLPFDQRQIPTNSGYRLYKNLKSEAMTLGNALTKARLRGLISPSLIKDGKNPEIRIGFKFRYEAAIEPYGIDLETGGCLDITIDDMYTWDRFKKWMRVGAVIQKEEFNNQSHRLVVVVEKVLDTDDVARVCRKHGADYIEFKGQPSVTREYEEVCFAKNDDGRPLHVVYISDLDWAGLVMFNAFKRNVNIMYPHDEHIFKRLILTREQAKGLPASFELDDKGISEKEKEQFRQETGSDECVELDALDEDVIAEIVDNYLTEFSGLEQDKINTDETREEANAPIKDAKKSIRTKTNRERYEEIRNRHVELAEQIQEFADDVAGDLVEIENDVKKFQDSLKKQINKKLKPEKKTEL